MTTHRARDAAQVRGLLTQMNYKLASVMADGAYDTASVYAAIEAHGSGPPPQILIPPRHDARTMGAANPSSQRDATIRAINAGGRRRWEHASGYTRRSLVETAMSRYKAIIGGSMRSRTMTSQKTEVALACAILNRMTQLGMPAGDCIA
ncbi:MAG: transposase [Pseudomonadales bacterium]